MRRETMRLLMYEVEGEGEPTPGVLRGDAVVNLRELFRAHGEEPPNDLLALIDRGSAGLGLVRSLLEKPEVGWYTRPLDEVRVLAPLDPPRGNVLAVGRN